MPELKRKTFDIELKQLSEDGTGTARIATLGVIDKDGDVARPGDFGEQMAAVQPSHDWQHHMLGKARIYEDGDQVLASFMLNLKTAAGREWYETLKFDLENGPAIQQWSYGYDAPDYEMGDFEGQRVRFLNKPGGSGIKVHEISPVLLGAGENTATLNVKGDKRATPRHSTATDEAPWSAAENRKRVLADKTADYYNRIYAWRDPDGEVGNKGSWKFIHHFVDEDGKAGAASTRACSNAIAVLNGARGGTTVPDADREGIHVHVGKHLKDAGMDVPDLKSASSGKQFETEIMETQQAAFDLQDRVQNLAERLEAVSVMREKQGRELPAVRIQQLKSTLAVLKSVQQLDELLNVPDPDAEIKEAALREAAIEERRRFQELQQAAI